MAAIIIHMAFGISPKHHKGKPRRAGTAVACYVDGSQRASSVK
jgi:hypothetical protein